MARNIFRHIHSKFVWPIVGALILTSSGHASIQVKPETETASVLEVNLEEGKAAIGGMFLPIPMLVEIDETLNARDIHVSGEDQVLTLANTFAGLAVEQRYAWVDLCTRLEVILPEISSEDASGDTFCMIVGQRGHVPKKLDLNAGKTVFEFSSFNTYPAPRVNTSIENYRIRNLQTSQGDLPIVIEEKLLNEEVPGLVIRSVGYENGRSVIRKKTWENIQSGDETEVPKGISLVGLRPSGEARILDTIFDCEPDFDINSLEPWGKIVGEKTSDFEFFAAMVHDTATCRETTVHLGSVAAGLPLQNFDKIKFRRPYLALFKNDELIFEGSNSASGRLSVYLEGKDPGEPDWVRSMRNPLAEDYEIAPTFLGDKDREQPVEAKISPARVTIPLADGSPFVTDYTVTGLIPGRVLDIDPDIADREIASLDPEVISDPVEERPGQPDEKSAEEKNPQQAPSASAPSASAPPVPESVGDCTAGGGCCSTIESNPVGSVIEPMPKNFHRSMAFAIDGGFVSLGSGWWPQSAGGYRIGGEAAQLQLQLPELGASLRLVIAVEKAEPVTIRSLMWEGNPVPRLNSEQSSSIAFDVTDLPRESDLALSLVTTTEEIGCRTASNGSELQSGNLVRSIALQSYGFGQPMDLVIRHDGTSQHASGTYQWLESIKSKSMHIELPFSELSDGSLICSNPNIGPSAEIESGEKFRAAFSRLQNSDFICDFDGVAAWLRSNGGHEIFLNGEGIGDRALINAIARNIDVSERMTLFVRQSSRIPLLKSAGFTHVFWQADQPDLTEIPEDQRSGIKGLVMSSSAFRANGEANGLAEEQPVFLRSEKFSFSTDCKSSDMPSGLFVPEATATYWNEFNKKCSRG